jgi:antitoxin component YwqK of YwqJK toxin-antitoxin module
MTPTSMAINILAHPGQSLSSVFVFLCLLISCRPPQSTSEKIAHADKLKLAQKGKIKYYKDKPYTGGVFKLDSLSGDTLLIENYWEGHKHGDFKRFYAHNQLFEKRSYRKGKKEGVHLGYWDNGNLAFEYHLKNDVYHGSLRGWNSAGQIIKWLNYDQGQESGRQQLWNDNGTIRTNYVIKNNRRYGLLGTKNCINVSDSLR